MSKQRVHRFTVSVTFNKKCLRRVALREVRDNIYGGFYCAELDDDEPATFRVRSITNKQSRRRRS